MPGPGNIVVLGAGQAGYWLVKTLRQKDYKGPITLLGDEPHPPYDRPPLSKQVLTGEVEPQSTWFITPDELAALAVEFRPGVRATAIDREARVVTTSPGAAVGYDHLVIATGARARRLDLPGEEAAPVFYLRSMKDCLALREVMTGGRRIIVVGGGLIGLEVAAAGVTRGCEVTIVEAADRVMARVVGPEISRFYEALHRDRGATIATGRMPVSIAADGGGCAVEFADGTRVAGDAIVAGIGAVPDDAIARDAGLATDNGILVDEFGRTGDSRISAVGDVTNHFNPLLGRRIRLECWQNAQNQAIAVAQTLCGDGAAYAETPWGWSDQYGINLQMLGAPDSFEDGLMRGDPGQGSFSMFYLKAGRIHAMAAVGAGRDVSVSRRLIARDIEVDAERLVDAATPLKSLLQ